YSRLKSFVLSVAKLFLRLCVLRAPCGGMVCRCLNLDSHQFRTPPGFPHRVHHVLGCKFPHHKGQVTLDGCLDGFPINPLNVFSTASASTVHFHDKFCVLHSSPCMVGHS